MTYWPEHVRGVTTHARRGAIRHGFRYGVDFVLIDAEAPSNGPLLFSRNRFNLASVHDCDHGGTPKAGRGSVWARAALSEAGLVNPRVVLKLLTQARFLGYVFNPVSVWLALDGDVLVAVIAEVSTPFGDRHSYLCHLPEFAPITSDTRIAKPKFLHVSPFQDVVGGYEFSFDIRADQILIRILHRNGDEGVVATLSGTRTRMTNAGLLRASFRRPFGALRTIGLIYWQALRLRVKGARYRDRPDPPEAEVT
jgi:DUF1365 family protein